MLPCGTPPEGNKQGSNIMQTKLFCCIAAIGILFSFCRPVLAQTDDPGCNKEVILTDQGCGRNCGTLVGCTSQAFHVDCSYPYQLKAWTVCSGTNCFHCASCVSIYTNPPGLTPVASISTAAICSQGDCEISVSSITLTPGDYIMYVCLVPCTENDQEACCGSESGCKAGGCLKWGTVPCP